MFWRLIVKPRIIINSVCVALVVGTLLNLVNQGDQLLAGVGIEWPRVLLNYVVPFCVASYSAAKTGIDQLSKRKESGQVLDQ